MVNINCKKARRVLVVGGLPEPIGGVTSFVYRLASNNKVVKVADIYPSRSKAVPGNFNGEVFYYKGLMRFLFSMILSGSFLKGVTDIHFNFSNTRSLVLFLIPFVKRGLKFHLMLHHGSLERCYPSFLFRYLLSKIDVVYSLSDEQTAFYSSYICNNGKLKVTTSYLPMRVPSLSCRIEEVDEFLGQSEFSVVSGYCSKIYNHDWAIRLFNEVERNNKLIIFLYGPVDESYFDLLAMLSGGNPRIKFVFNVSQVAFNYYLSRASSYFRLNSVDSFGIAVADAVNYGVPVLASDVCRRYVGSYLFHDLSYKCFADAYLKLKNSPTALPAQGGRSSQFSYSFDESL